MTVFAAAVAAFGVVAGSPAVAQTTRFDDVPAGAYYSTPVADPAEPPLLPYKDVRRRANTWRTKVFVGHTTYAGACRVPDGAQLWIADGDGTNQRMVLSWPTGLLYDVILSGRYHHQSEQP